MTEESKTWNSQLAEWYHRSDKTMRQIQDESGIPLDSFKDYVGGRVTRLDKISLKRRQELYKLTGLECFKVPEEVARQAPEKIVRETSVTSLDDHVTHAEHAFYVLCHSLEILRPYPDLRKELAKRLYQPNVGRLTSYLEGIYTDNAKIIPLIPKLQSKRDE